MVDKIWIIIPAHNEERYIGHILKALKEVVAWRNQSAGPFGFKEKLYYFGGIIVVNDGSNDKTAVIAKRNKVELVDLPKNFGKAFAFYKGVERAKQNGATIVVMLDADLEAVTQKQLDMLLKPVVLKNCKMAVGTVHEDSTFASGQRAIRISALDPLFKGNRKWQMYFGIKQGTQKRRMGYALEYGLNQLLPKIEVKTNFRTQRWYGLKSDSSGKLIDYSAAQGIEMQREQRISKARQKLANRLRAERKKMLPKRVHPKK